MHEGGEEYESGMSLHRFMLTSCRNFKCQRKIFYINGSKVELSILNGCIMGTIWIYCIIFIKEQHMRTFFGIWKQYI